LTEIVNETLATHFGKEAAETIYIYLEGNGLKKKDISNEVKIFFKEFEGSLWRRSPHNREPYHRKAMFKVQFKAQKRKLGFYRSGDCNKIV
jgi:hypothetical protein